MQENKPVLIVGLGNPGPEYEFTRHNVGFMAIDTLAPDGSWKKEKNALTLHCEQNGLKIIFVKPQTYMNNSGEAVAPLMAFYKIPLENLIVIHDDMDLKIGDVRQKIGGSSAGHNGIKSIDKMVGPDYKRVRIGIGHPRDFDLPMNPADWVLGKFTTEQLKTIKQVLQNLIV